MILSNLHTHTNLCDGAASVDEMARSAIALGFKTLGFSGHAPSAIGQDYCMSFFNAKTSYKDAVEEAKRIYAGDIEIYCGLENELTDPFDCAQFDYSIGSVHHVFYGDGNKCTVDASKRAVLDGVRDGFGGDGAAYALAYYNSIIAYCEDARLEGRRPADIIGHFDLPRKFNGDNERALFDTGSKPYQNAALYALEAVCERDMILEVSSGIMAAGLSDMPYPEPFILRRAKELGMRIAINSDAHKPEFLNYAFDKIEALLLGIGFVEAWTLSSNGFVPYPLGNRRA